MIPVPKNCFWMVKVDGELGGSVLSNISPRTASLASEVLLASVVYETDIEATSACDSIIDQLRSQLIDPEIMTKINPLFVPSSVEVLENSFDPTEKENTLKFNAMDGSPFTLKMVEIKENHESVIQAKVMCEPFELPPLNEIIQAHSELRLN